MVKVEIPTFSEINVASKKPTNPTLPDAIDFNPVTPNVQLPKDPALPEPPTFKIILGADCNVGCDSGNTSNGGIRSKRKSNFDLKGRAQDSIQSILHYTWFNDAPNESGYAFKMYTDTGSNFTLGTDIPNSSNGLKKPAGKEVFFDSYNFGDEFERTIANSQGIERNHQYFFIGGSRFIESDNAYINTIKIPKGYILNLGGILTLGLVSQGHNTTQLNEGLITDKKEKNDKWIKDMPTDNGKDYLTIHGPDSDYKIKRSADGYVGYKVGIALVQEDSVNGGKILNTGEIDFRGEKSIGLYTYLPNEKSDREMINKGKINLSGKESYGIKLAAGTTGNASMINDTNGEINLRKNPDGVDKADNSAAMALMKDDSVRGGGSLARGKAINEGKINLTGVENSLGMYVNINSDMTNKGSIKIDSEINKATGKEQPVNIAMRADGDKNATVINNSSGTISLDGSYAIGMLAKGAKLENKGKIATGTKGVSNATGIAGINRATVKINNSSITLRAKQGGAENIGVFLKNGSTGTGNSNSIEISGDKSTGILVTKGKETGATSSTLTLGMNTNSKIKVDGKGVSGVIADESEVTLTGNSKIELADNGNASSAIGDNGSYGVLVKGETGKFIGEQITVDAKIATNRSAGLYSEGKLTVGNVNIEAEDGAVNFFAKDKGIIELKGQTSKSTTGKKSLLFYTDGDSAKIKISGKMIATVKGGDNADDVNGRGTAFLYKHSGTSYGSFGKTEIENWAKKNFGDGTSSTLNNLTLNMEDNSRLFVASNVEMKLSDTDVGNLQASLGGTTITGSNYKTFMLYDSKLNINQDVNLNENDNAYNKLEISSSSVENNFNIKGTQSKQIAIAQENKDSLNKARVTLTNNGSIDLSGTKSTGIYGKFAKINNSANKTIKVGDESTGIYALNNTEATNAGTIEVGSKSTGVFYSDVKGTEIFESKTELNNTGKITLAGEDSVGMIYEAGNVHNVQGNNSILFKNTGEIFGIREKSVGMYAKEAKNGISYKTENSGDIKLGDASSLANSNIGMYTDASATGKTKLVNSKNITVGKNSIGMYGVDLENSKDIIVGDSGIAMYSKGTSGTIDIKTDSNIMVGKNQAAAVYSIGTNEKFKSETGSNIKVGDKSYGFINKGIGNQLDLKGTVTLENNGKFVYSEDTTGIVNNSGKVLATGNKNIGIYAKGGTITNSGTIDFTLGKGNIGVYGTNSANITNSGTIKLGSSTDTERSIGLTSDNGTITNSGTIAVTGKKGIGLYTKGTGTINNTTGTIAITGAETIGAYADENSSINLTGGNLKITGEKTIGYYLAEGKGSKIANSAKVEVVGKDSTGIFVDKGTLSYTGETIVKGDGVYGIVANEGTINATDGKLQIEGSSSNQTNRGTVAVVANTGSQILGHGLEVIGKLKGEKSIGLYSAGNLEVAKADIETENGAVNFFADNGTMSIGKTNTTSNVITGTGADRGSLLFYTKGNNAKILLNGKMTATIKGNLDPTKTGTAFYYKGNDYSEFSSSKIQEWAKKNFGNGNKSTLSNLTLKMEDNSRLFVVSDVKMNLSDTNIGNLETALGGAVITGDKYKTFMLYDSKLNINQNVNLDSDSDSYNMLEISSSSVENNSSIRGKQANQIAIAQENKDSSNKNMVNLTNNGIIDLLGTKSTGIYGKFAKIDNNADKIIKVGDESTGIYALNNTEVTNAGTIEVGSKSTGVFYSDVITGTKAEIFTTKTELNNAGKITLAGEDSVGMIYEAGNVQGNNSVLFKNTGEISGTSEKSVGMYAKETKNSVNYISKNEGNIKLGDASSLANSNIGMYTDAITTGKTKLINSKNITVGKNSIGMYGVDLENSKDIIVGNSGIAMYSKGTLGTIDIKADSNITVGENQAAAVYSSGTAQTVNSEVGSIITVKDKSYGFINKGIGNRLDLKGTATLSKDGIFIYSEDGTGTIVNTGGVTALGDKNIGIYTKGGTITNSGAMNFIVGKGNIGIYGTNSANITNSGTISVGTSIDKNSRSIGLTADSGTITNSGTVYVGLASVDGKYGLGLYTKGTGTIENTGDITLTGAETIGAYADGNSNINLTSGTVTTTGEKTIGYYLAEGTNSKIENPTKIEVVGKESTGIFVDKGTLSYTGTTTVKGDGAYGIVANEGTINVTDGKLKIEGSSSNQTNRGTVAIVTNTTSQILGHGLEVSGKLKGEKSIGLYSAGKLEVAKADIETENGAVNFFADNGTISIGKANTTSNVVTGTGVDRGSLLFHTIGNNAKILLKGNMTATIKGDLDPTKTGTAFYYKGVGTLGTLNTYTEINPNNFAVWANQNFGDGTSSTLDKLTLNMEDNSRLLLAGLVKMDLSSTTTNNLFSGLASHKPTIVGNNYRTFMLYKSYLNINQDINLDDNNDAYNRLEISNSSITNNKNIVGTKDEQVAIAQKNDDNIKSVVTLINGGTIDLSGKKATGIYGNNAIVENEVNSTINLKDDSTGIYGLNNTEISNNGAINIATNSVGVFYSDILKENNKETVYETKTGLNNQGLINIFGNNSVGMMYEPGNISPANSLEFKNTNKIIEISGEQNVGMYAKAAKQGNYQTINNGEIKLGNAGSLKAPSVAMYTNTNRIGTNLLKNTGNIKVGKNSIGLYGYEAENSGNIEVGNAGVGIYSKGGNISLTTGKIKTGSDEAIAVYTVGSAQIINNSGTDFELGKNSFGFVNVGIGNKINSTLVTNILTSNSLYIYSNDRTGEVTNSTNLTSNGSENYGIYSAGKVYNTGNMDFSVGTGNVGIYSIKGGEAFNSGDISIGASDIDNKYYGIGMAAGYKTEDTGYIKNTGTINVNGVSSIGMYASGRNPYKAYDVENNGNIILNANKTTGIFLDNGAKGINRGTIKTGTSGLSRVVGVYVTNGAELENASTGHILIDATEARGAYLKGGIVKNYGEIKVIGKNSVEIFDAKADTTTGVGGVEIDTKSENIIIKRDGKKVELKDIKVVNATDMKNPPKNVVASSIGMYIDTSRKNYTKPIENLGALTNEADLIIGNEASKYTNEKDIIIRDTEIIKPYRDAQIANAGIVDKWSTYSGSLTWTATTKLDKNNYIEEIVMSKIPYTAFAGELSTPVSKEDTFNFLNGLEQRYDKNNLDSKEKELFDKINSIGKNEEVLLSQAVDEMMGHQYGNVQQRIYDTGNILNKEFRYLKEKWDTKSKDSNKIKAFGMRGEYNTDTAGIIGYKNQAEGFAYLHEDETAKLGNTTGWYTGFVHNEFKFKDIGESREHMHQVKLGIFNSKAFDHNNSLNWTISGEGFVGYNRMKRRYLVVDEIYRAKANYWSYGVGLNNELSKTFRTSEHTFIKPYGSLKLEYGKFEDIEEKSGEVRLEVNGNDYFSVKPEVGVELGTKHLFGNKRIVTGLSVAYETELGKVQDVENEVRVNYTNADWYNIRSEKEDRDGNVKLDLNAGYDNEAFGVTANIGYDTKGENVRGGVGLRIIF